MGLPDTPLGLHGLGLVTGLVLYAVLVTYMYLHNKNAVFHETAYGIQVAGIMFLSYLKSRTAPPRIRILFPVAITMYLSAFALWNVDNHLCGHLQLLRAYLGVFAPVIELHAWWHIGVGIGSYLYVVFSIATRMRELNQRVALTTFAGLPIIAPNKTPHSKTSNGKDI